MGLQCVVVQATLLCLLHVMLSLNMYERVSVDRVEGGKGEGGECDTAGASTIVTGLSLPSDGKTYYT